MCQNIEKLQIDRITRLTRAYIQYRRSKPRKLIQLFVGVSLIDNIIKQRKKKTQKHKNKKEVKTGTGPFLLQSPAPRKKPITNHNGHRQKQTNKKRNAIKQNLISG